MAAVTTPKPFLRWVGGKARLVARLLPYVPSLRPQGTYYEPFLGAGSLFFAVQPRRAVLADQNPDLIQCFERVKTRPDLVWRHLRTLLSRQARADYYALRAEFNASGASYRAAALFIYLNKTCFNGIWRVNRNGEFNVPYGAKAYAGFPTLADLMRCSATLAPATLFASDFETTLVSAESGDFVYLDPPYLPLSSTAFFRHYTVGRFAPEDHERVALAATELAARGAIVMVTEGDSPLVRKWYRDFQIFEVDVRRSVSCDARRIDARELIITSYPLDRDRGSGIPRASSNHAG